MNGAACTQIRMILEWCYLGGGQVYTQHLQLDHIIAALLAAVIIAIIVITTIVIVITDVWKLKGERFGMCFEWGIQAPTILKNGKGAIKHSKN